jgi:uncharacterized ion transporter superfamily protein YfcC
MNLKKLLSIPSPYTVIAIVILLAAVATWLLPAGAYQQLTFDKEENQFVVTGQGESSNLPATQESLTQLGISISINKFTDGSIYKPIAVPGTYSRLEAKPQGAVEIAQSPVKGIYEAMDVILFVLIIGGFIGVFKASGRRSSPWAARPSAWRRKRWRFTPSSSRFSWRRATMRWCRWP